MKRSLVRYGFVSVGESQSSAASRKPLYTTHSYKPGPISSIAIFLSSGYKFATILIAKILISNVDVNELYFNV